MSGQKAKLSSRYIVLLIPSKPVYRPTLTSSLNQTRLFLTIALGVQAGLDVIISGILVAKVAKIEKRDLR